MPEMTQEEFEEKVRRKIEAIAKYGPYVIHEDRELLKELAKR